MPNTRVRCRRWGIQRWGTALLFGLSAGHVSAETPVADTDNTAIPLFLPAIFSGSIGDHDHVLAHMARVGDDLSLRVQFGPPVGDRELIGPLDAQGRFELVEQEVSGKASRMVGRFSRGAATAQGAWHLNGHSESIPFQWRQIALGVEVSGAVSMIGRSFPFKVNYPLLQPDQSEAGATALNRMLLVRVSQHRAQMEDSFTRGGVPEDVRFLSSSIPDRPGRGFQDYGVLRDAGQRWSIEVELVEHAARFASCEMALYLHGGGARGNITFDTLNLRVGPGDPESIDYAALFVDEAAGTAEVSRRFYQDLERRNVAYLFRDGAAAVKPEDISKFTIRRQGLVVRFAHHPGLDEKGGIAVFVPWDALRAHLRPGLPESLFTE